MDKVTIKVSADTSDIDVAQEKADKLVETLKKANSLADELAKKN